VDEGGFLPAPGSDPDQLGRDRLHEEFACDTNDEGGAIVVDTSERVAVTSMPNSFPSERCIRVNGNAVVVDDMGVPVNADEGGAVVADEGGAVVADEGGAVVADAGNDVSLGAGAPTSDTELAYCMVAMPTSSPIVIRPGP
jgi:hypothetical protein